MPNPLTPERRAALRARAESHARKIEAGLQDGVPTTGYLTLTPADVLDLLAALEAAEVERDQLAEDFGRAFAELKTLRPDPPEAKPRPSRAEAEAVAGRYRDALPSVEEHLADKHAEAAGPRLLQAIRDALEAAEAEGIDRYRGTDERREFVRILRRAMEKDDG